jgi:hypothetical protein
MLASDRTIEKFKDLYQYFLSMKEIEMMRVI